MKRKIIILCICFIIAVVGVYRCMTKTVYLYLDFFKISTPCEATHMVVSPNIKLQGYSNDSPMPKPFITTGKCTDIWDKETIDKVIDYLKNIPLVYTFSDKIEKYQTDNVRKGSIYFYNDEGIICGIVRLAGEHYIQSSINAEVLRTKSNETLIISGLEQLNFD